MHILDYAPIIQYPFAIFIIIKFFHFLTTETLSI